MADAYQLDHERTAHAGCGRGALVADVAGGVEVDRVGADQAFVEDRGSHRGLLRHEVALVHADVAALVLDGGRTDDVLDAAQQDDVAGQNTRGRLVADRDGGLRIEQVDVELEGVADGLGVEADVIRAGSVVRDVVDDDVDHGGTVVGVDVVDHQVERGIVGDLHRVPGALAFDLAAVTPDHALRRTREVVGIEGQLAGLVVDDVVEDDLRVERIEGSEGIPLVLARIDAQELDVGQRDNLAGGVDLELGVRLAQQEDVRLPEDFAQRISRIAVFAPVAGIDPSARAACTGLGGEIVLRGVHVHAGTPDDGVQKALDLGAGVEIDVGTAVCVAAHGTEVRIRTCVVVGLQVARVDRDAFVADDLGTVEQAHLVERGDEAGCCGIAVCACGRNVGLGIGIAAHLVDVGADSHRAADQVCVALHFGACQCARLAGGADPDVADAVGSDAQAAGIDLCIGVAICFRPRVDRELVTCRQVAIDEGLDTVVEVHVAEGIRPGAEPEAARGDAAGHGAGTV